jgi:hypothetical protein
MFFLSKLLQGIAFLPAIVHGIEGLLGHNTGNDKKQAALSFASAAIGVTDAVASKDIADPARFNDGLSKIIDGVVQCFNASMWAKAK